MDNRYAKKKTHDQKPTPYFQAKIQYTWTKRWYTDLWFYMPTWSDYCWKKNQDRAAFARGQKPNPPKTYHFDAEKLGKIGYTVAIFYLNWDIKELIFLTFFWLVEHQKIFWACIKTETQQFRLVAELRFEYPEAKHHLETGDTYFKRESVPLGRCPCPFVPRLVGSGFKPALLLEVATGRIDSIPAATLRSNRAPYVMLRLRIYLLFLTQGARGRGSPFGGPPTPTPSSDLISKTRNVPPKNRHFWS